MASTGATPTVPPKGTAAEQTRPYVRPRVGHARTRFVLRLTLGIAAGHMGGVATDYRVQLRTPRPRCTLPTKVASVASGAAHETVPIALRAPAAGWCNGRYQVTVLLERGPYCPAPAPGQPITVCPEFATQELDVGSTHFTVKRGR
jgi:hypothetical protein